MDSYALPPNDQGQRRESRVAGWPSDGAPCYVSGTLDYCVLHPFFYSTVWIRNRIIDANPAHFAHPCGNAAMASHSVVSTRAQLAFHLATGVTETAKFERRVANAEELVF